MTTVTVCTTCRAEAHREDKSRAPDGERFLDLMRDAASGNDGLVVRGVACLMGCDRGCNVAIAANGKMTYVLGRFDGTTEDALALVEYATRHHGSPSGTVPFRDWPQGVKGHFVARIPPPDGSPPEL